MGAGVGVIGWAGAAPHRSGGRRRGARGGPGVLGAVKSGWGGGEVGQGSGAGGDGGRGAQ